MVFKQRQSFKKKYLIINADDLGMSPGINRGIIQAFQSGVVTSASLLVDTPYTTETIRMLKGFPQFDVGLHISLEAGKSEMERGYRFWEKKIENQVVAYQSLLGVNPSHIDFHGGFRVSAEIAFAAEVVAAKYELHNRDSHINPVISRFYGERQGRSVFEAISLSALMTIIKGIKSGLTEMICHPGNTNHRLKDPYRIARNIELKTLTNSAIPSLIKKEKIVLINYQEARQLQLLGHA